MKSPSIEAAATKSALAASHGIDGMTASMAKGALAGNLLADAIKRAIEFAKEWTVEAAKEAAHADRAVAITRMLAAKTPYVLNIMVPYTEHVLPMIPGGMTYKDIITTSAGVAEAAKGFVPSAL